MSQKKVFGWGWDQVGSSQSSPFPWAWRGGGCCSPYRCCCSCCSALKRWPPRWPSAPRPRQPPPAAARRRPRRRRRAPPAWPCGGQTFVSCCSGYCSAARRRPNSPALAGTSEQTETSIVFLFIRGNDEGWVEVA